MLPDDAAPADRRPAGQPLSAGRRDRPGRRRLVRRDPAARQPGRAGRRRRHGPLHDLGRDHGPAAHHRADPGRARPAAAGGAAPPRRAGPAARQRPDGDLPVRGLRPGRAPHHHRQRRASAARTAAPRRPRRGAAGTAGRADRRRRRGLRGGGAGRARGRHAAALHRRAGRVAAAGRVDRHRAAAGEAGRDGAADAARRTRRRWSRCATRCWTCSGPGDRDDDIALLAARFDGIAPSDVAYWFLDPEDADGRAGPAGWPGGRWPAGAWRSCATRWSCWSARW